MPLISCYLFVKITKHEYVPVLSTEGVVRFIQFSNNLISIPEHEIQLIQRVIGYDLPIEIEQKLIREGDQVEIISGSLAGMTGTLLEEQSKNKVLINLKHLGYTLKIELPISYLKKLAPAIDMV